MFRFISSITFLLSFLIASSTVPESLSRVSGFSKTDIVKSKNVPVSSVYNKLSEAERNQKLEAVKDKSSSLIQDFESKLKIAKKIYSSKTNKAQTLQFKNKSLKKSSFDPNSVDLKIKKRALPSRTFNISSDKRNIANTNQESMLSRDHVSTNAWCFISWEW